MAIDVVMPKYGPNMLEGLLVRWLKRVGDRVQKDEELAEVETEKVTAIVLCPESGVLAALLVEEGTEVPVGGLIARIETS